MQPKIVLIGHVCIDHNETEHAKYVGWGSGVLYTAKYFQDKLALKPKIVTQYGPDLLPYSAEFALYPDQPPYDGTLIYENTITNGKRTQRCLNIDDSKPLQLSADEKALIGDADIVIFATLLPNYSVQYVQDLMALAPQKSLKMLCPQGYFRQVDEEGNVSPRLFSEATELLSLFDIAVYSDEDYPDALGVAREWSQSIDTKLLVTQGSKGATIVSDGHMEQIPTEAVAPDDIVDSVGCGDVFAAAMIYEFYKNDDIVLAIQAAHKVAHDKLLAVVSAGL